MNTVYTFKEVQKCFTDKVAEYIAKGYTIHTSSMTGSYMGAKVDFIVGHDIHRVVMYEDRVKHPTNKYETLDVYKIEVLVYRNVANLHVDTLWYDRGEVIDTIVFYKINPYKSDNKTTFVKDFEDMLKIYDIQSDRMVRKHIKSFYEITLTKNNKKKVLNLVHNHKGYKAVTAGMINRVVRDGKYYNIHIQDKKTLTVVIR